MSTERTRAIVADAVITGDREVIKDGAIVVDDRGEIVDVGRADEVLLAHGGISQTRVNGVVFPGLINAHTHVELSALRGHVQGGAGFVPWVERLICARADVLPEEDGDAIGRAADELFAAGTVAVGEVTNTLAAVHALAKRGIGGAIFHEVFGVSREAVQKRIDALPAERERLGAWPTSDLAYAPAPHTLYTTHADAVRLVLEGVQARGERTTIHLSEHASERRFLEAGDGPIADWYERMLNIPRASLPSPRLSPVKLAESLGALATNVLLVHLTDARPAELELVAASGAPVVVCPRSNLYIETKLPPLLAMRAAGIEPALGTDSLASNASLDVLAEARALADRFPMIPAIELVRMATYGGARALGRADLGRIVKGARPGLVAIDGDPGADACAFLLKNVRAPRRFVAQREQTEQREIA